MAMADIIHKHDFPPGHMLDTREGMEIAYGILWMTWTDGAETAASMARHILRAELSEDECGKGIDMARRLIWKDGDGP